MRDFHEAHAGLNQAPSQQAFPSEIIGARALSATVGAANVANAIQLFRRFALVGNVHRLRHFLLHFEGEFVALDHALNIGIRPVEPQRLAVERLQQVKFGALNRGIERRLEVADFGAGDGAGAYLWPNFANPG